MLKKIFSITAKELKGFYNSPIAYIITSVFLVFMAVWLFFILHFVDRGEAD
ncbi:MAG: ABC transporter permease, partial [Spirochaetaceae bacterium]